MNMGRLTDTIIRHEGAVIRGGRHMPYKDTVGKMTIGYGRNITDRGISDTEARTLLINDIQDTINELRAKLFYFDSLDEVRQEVLVNMGFNMGVPGLLRFTKTLGYVQEGEYGLAGSEMLNSRWAEQVGYRAQELSQIMITGEAE